MADSHFTYWLADGTKHEVQIQDFRLPPGMRLVPYDTCLDGPPSAVVEMSPGEVFTHPYTEYRDAFAQSIKLLAEELNWGWKP